MSNSRGIPFPCPHPIRNASFLPAINTRGFQKRRSYEYLHLRDIDQGIGIPEEAISKLFSPYTLIASDKTRYIQGTGLGLSIIRHIVEMHKGVVWVESTPDYGSTFHVLLPLTQSL